MSRCSRFAVAAVAIVVAATVYCGAAATAAESALGQDVDQAMETLVDSLLGQMTIEEKLGQLAQYRGGWSQTGPTVSDVQEQEIRTGLVGSLLGAHGAAHTRRLQEMAVENSRLKIPLLFGHDVIHGFRTVFPVPLAEASSWDPAAVERASRVAAREATAHGIHWTFAPVCDIARDPRWGRIVEGAGEDPYLCGVLAAARVRGFQGTDLTADDTLLACPKHFVAYGGAEGGRDYNTVDLSERTLREIYLAPFKDAVDAGAETVMASFNEINGVPAHANRELLTGVLRNEWGFDGLVVSDYTGVLELMKHGVAASREAAGVLALRAGVDMDMVSGIYSHDLPALVRAGVLAEATVDRAVRRVLRAKYKLGLFDNPYRYSDPQREKQRTFTAEHRKAALDLARKSIVLLKNDDETLPLPPSIKSVAVIGALADNQRAVLGGWAMDGHPQDAVTILAGIQGAAPEGAKIVYAKGAEVEGDDRSGFAEAVDAAREADAVVLVVGEHHDMSSEALNRASIDLPGVQSELVRAVHATGTPVIVVLVNGRPLATPWVAEHCPAILETWFLGTEMGTAVADVVFGRVNPSGKLPVTIPRAVGQIPIYYNHKNTGRPASADDKYTSKYLDVPWTPQFAFGHGLSYTKFQYSDLLVTPEQIAEGERVAVQVTVTNAGDRAGDEVAQLYIRDDVGSVTRPVKELKRFERVSLEPGESKTVRFALSFQDLAFYDLDMQYVVEPGVFTVFAGGSSQTSVEGAFEVVE